MTVNNLVSTPIDPSLIGLCRMECNNTGTNLRAKIRCELFVRPTTIESEVRFNNAGANVYTLRLVTSPLLANNSVYL